MLKPPTETGPTKAVSCPARPAKLTNTQHVHLLATRRPAHPLAVVVAAADELVTVVSLACPQPLSALFLRQAWGGGSPSIFVVAECPA